MDKTNSANYNPVEKSSPAYNQNQHSSQQNKSQHDDTPDKPFSKVFGEKLIQSGVIQSQNSVPVQFNPNPKNFIVDAESYDKLMRSLDKLVDKIDTVQKKLDEIEDKESLVEQGEGFSKSDRLNGLRINGDRVKELVSDFEEFNTDVSQLPFDTLSQFHFDIQKLNTLGLMRYANAMAGLENIQKQNRLEVCENFIKFLIKINLGNAEIMRNRGLENNGYVNSMSNIAPNFSSLGDFYLRDEEIFGQYEGKEIGSYVKAENEKEENSNANSENSDALNGLSISYVWMPKHAIKHNLHFENRIVEAVYYSEHDPSIEFRKLTVRDKKGNEYAVDDKTAKALLRICPVFASDGIQLKGNENVDWNDFWWMQDKVNLMLKDLGLKYMVDWNVKDWGYEGLWIKWYGIKVKRRGWE